jgi:hypothetical protein
MTPLLVLIINIISIRFQVVLKQRPTLNEAKTGTQIKVIENNAALVAKLKDYNLPDKEFFVLKPKKEMN